MHRTRSPLGGYTSPCKRQRLSSPTYDNQVGDLSEQDIEAFDQIDAKLSQGSPSTSQHTRQLDITDTSGRKENIPISDHDDLFSPFASGPDDVDNPFAPKLQTTKLFTAKSNAPAEFTSASKFSSEMFLGSPEHPSSPEVPPERDYSSWFEPELVAPSQVGFLTAKFAAAPALPTVVPGAGFMTASRKGWVAPSHSALAKAEEKMREIWREGDQEPVAPNAGSPHFDTPSPLREALRPVENSFPVSPSPAGFHKPSTRVNNPPHPSELDQLKPRNKPKPFKSPLIKSASPSKPFHSSPGFAGSPLNPNRLPHISVSTGSQHPLAATPVASAQVRGSAYPFSDSTTLSTPVRPLGITRRGVRDTPPKFVTPFKAGMKPGEPNCIALDQRTVTTVPVDDRLLRERRPDPQAVKLNAEWKAFDLTKPLNRVTLAASGLVPQSYSSAELEGMGINAAELSHVTPAVALYYSFHTTSAFPPPTDSNFPSSTPRILGASAALTALLERGCVLATKPWVDNHWSLILWKLAGMVSLDPDREGDPSTKRWCWAETICQLLYRYERELNGGSRPPLRLVATHDVPASCPMVLCVSNITWSEAGITDDGLPIEPHPELEVTDGWYRLRARVDQPLARAIRRGVIRVGRKIAVAGARLSSERKDPTEILEAYNSVSLVLSGNSSHLVAWHTKLGFQMGMSIATLNSLTPDGGLVVAMDIVVMKAYPLAFIEFIEDESGNKRREGPRNESEEARVHELWKRKREVEESKLRDELEKKLSRYEGYIDKLQHQAGSRFNPGEDDSPPDYIDNLYDALEEPSEARAVPARLSCNDAGWLARFIRDRVDKERERAGEEIEQELKSTCAPREVRNFRVLIVKDVRTQRRPSHRIAQLTVWDVLSISLSEGGKAGAFEPGQRFRVTNVIPTQQNSWMEREPGSEVFLSTRRDSRWTRIK